MIKRLTQLEWRHRFLTTGKDSFGEVWIHRLPTLETVADSYAAAQHAFYAKLPLEDLTTRLRHSELEAKRAQKEDRSIVGDLPADVFVSLGKLRAKSTPRVFIDFSHDNIPLVHGYWSFENGPEWWEHFTDVSWLSIDRWLRG